MVMRVVVVGSVIFAATVAVFAGFEMPTQAYQPLEVDGPGLLLMEMPFIAMGSYWDSPGAEVLQTVAASRAADDSCDRNRNAANTAGIRFELLPGTPDSTNHNQTCPGLVGDTLKVRVDLTRASSEWGLQGLVPLTLKCGLFNAKRRWPRVRHLEYDIVGNPAYVRYSGVYDLEPVEIPRGPYQDRGGLAPPDSR
jgi:hypothetical protein